MEILTNVLPCFGSFALAYFVFVWLNRRHIDDAKAAFWANVKEPIIYLSQDIDDDGVLERVANARAKLAKHGNVYLRAEDVHFFVFGSDKDNAAWDFEAWRDMRLQQAIDIRRAFRELKARQMGDSKNEFGAAEMFGGQKNPN